MIQDDYYTVKDAMKLLSVSRTTLYKKINNKEILSKKIDSRRYVYIDSDDLEIAKQANEETSHDSDLIEHLNNRAEHHIDKFVYYLKQLREADADRSKIFLIDESVRTKIDQLLIYLELETEAVFSLEDFNKDFNNVIN